MINQLIKLIIFPIILFSVACEAYTGNLATVIDLAKDYRTSDNLKKEMILQKVGESLSHYNTLSEFVADYTGKPGSDFQFIDVQSTEDGGKSKDFVFFATDQADNPLYVIKAFHAPNTLASKFLKEISSLSFILDRHLHHSTPVYPLAVGSAEIQGETVGLLLESLASGKRIDNTLFAVAKSEGGIRQAMTLLAQKAFKRLGQAYAELSIVPNAEKGPLPETAYSHLKDKFGEVVNGPAKEMLEGRIDLDKIQSFIDVIIPKMRKLHFPKAYRHGDPNLGNMIYDFEKDVLYFIDVAKLHDSFDSDLNPTSDSAYDFTRIEESLRRKALSKLNPEEVQLLLNAFYAGYQQVAGKLPPRILRDFWTFDSKIGRLRKYADYPEIANPIEKEARRLTFEDTVQYFIDRGF